MEHKKTFISPEVEIIYFASSVIMASTADDVYDWIDDLDSNG